MEFFKEEGYSPTVKIGFFDLRQISAIFMCIAASALLLICVKNLNYKNAIIIYKFFAFINLFLLINRQAVKKFVFKDYDTKTILPLHLCSLNLMILCAASVTMNETLLNYVFAASPIPAFLALIFPEADAARFPKINMRSIEYYTCHTLLILLPVIPVLFFGFRPKIASFLPCFAIFSALFISVALINTKLKSNYMYICYGPEHTPLKTAEKIFGRKIYSIINFLFFTALFFIMNMLYIFIS